MHDKALAQRTVVLVLVLECSRQTPGGISRQRGMHTDGLWLQTILEAAQRWRLSDVLVQTVPLRNCLRKE